MTVVPDGTGRIKVVLSTNDVYELGIDFNTIDCADQKTRLILRALFKTATEQAGIEESSERLLIEAYPHLGGGGILYFTPLAERHRKKLKIMKKSVQNIYDFNYSGYLLDAIEKLYSGINKNTRSILFDIDGNFRLLVDNNGSHELDEIKEFCDAFYTGDSIKKYTCEHGRALTGDNAILEIGERLLNAM